MAVIIAGYLPIYVLSGPPGRLFRPMADTMSFALLGSLLCSLTLLPVLCSYFLRKHVKEPTVPVVRARARAPTAGCSDVSLRHQTATVVVCLAIFGASLLLVPFIGAEFMPHLDEGAHLGSRDDAVHDFLRRGVEARAAGARDPARAFRRSRRWPTSWAGPTTAPIPSGFSMTSITSGSSPTTIRRGAGPIQTKPQLIDAIQEKLGAFPGIIFNYTQPAEDAVDEAETGLKSSLAVKIFGTDLDTLEIESGGRAASHLEGSRHHEHHAGPRARTAEPDRSSPTARRSRGTA